MNISVNGEPHVAAAGSTVADLVDALAGRRGGVAVAVNEDVVPRAVWAETPLRAGDRVEILTAVQGG